MPPIKPRKLNAVDVHVGSRIRSLRIHMKMSQTDLADGLGITFQQIQKYEKGTNRVGWRWVEHYKLPEETEREHISRAVASLRQTLGNRPLGWYCRYGPSVNTRRLLVEEGGFLYDSDAYNDDLPYYVDAGGKAHLVVPYGLANNDVKFARGGFATARDYDAWHRDAFDFLYAEGKRTPRMMSVGLHARLIGHPARAAGLQRFLEHVVRHKAVWICARIDIARHWLARHPPVELPT